PQRILQAFALIGFTAVLTGSLAMVAAAISFCATWTSRRLAQLGVIFLVSAAAISGISHAFPVRTYAWVPILMPWSAAIFSGMIMLLVAVIRGVLSRTAKFR